ncbi:hypothetical protein BsWGS_10974 [Bradybaena similaris]
MNCIGITRSGCCTGITRVGVTNQQVCTTSTSHKCYQPTYLYCQHLPQVLPTNIFVLPAPPTSLTNQHICTASTSHKCYQPTYLYCQHLPQVLPTNIFVLPAPPTSVTNQQFVLQHLPQVTLLGYCYIWI